MGERKVKREWFEDAGVEGEEKEKLKGGSGEGELDSVLTE